MTETTVQPNRERIQLWVDDLRATELKQGKKRLRSADGAVCCLYVACNIAACVGGATEWNEASQGFIDVGGSRTFTTHLTPATVKWYGLEDDNCPLDCNLSNAGVPRNAVDANDAYGLTFAQIAAALERTYLQPVPAC